MKKHYTYIGLIIIGTILLSYTFLQSNKEVYPEVIFADDAKKFDTTFTTFMNNVKGNIKDIRVEFSDQNTIKNNTTNNEFFIDFMDRNPYLISTTFIQGNHRVAIHKDDETYKIAIDSTDIVDVVQWKRFKDKKVVSSWDESYKLLISEIEWYKTLKSSNDDIKWFFDLESDAIEVSTLNKELFFSGYSYYNDTTKNIILFRYSRIELLATLNILNSYKNINLILKTASGKHEDLSVGINQNFRELGDSTNKNDSLGIISIEHLKRFSKSKNGIFNINYNNEVYWNSFKRFSKKEGILFYLLSIPNKEIVGANKTGYKSSIMFWGALVLIIIGFILFLRRKFAKKGPSILTDIAPVKELLEHDESRLLEFKSSLRWDYRQQKVNVELEKVIFKTIAAFGNTDGGILLIGVDDDKNILGLEPDFNTFKKPDADFFEIHLHNLLHAAMGVKYVTNYIRMQFEDFENNKTVCKIQVLAASEPLFIKSKNKNGITKETFYVRSGNSSQEIKPIAEINDYLNTHFEK